MDHLKQLNGPFLSPAADSPHNGSMHACGHDLHMTGMIGAARLLTNRRAGLTGDLVFMFRPARRVTTARLC
jgi:hippurate hydrolase